MEFSISHEASRKEQVRLHGILSVQERALRDDHFRGIQEIDELRSQGRQIDELSRQRLKESQSSINELTAQITELQERVDFMNDSREFQEIDPVCSGRLSQVPTPLAVIFLNLKVCRAATKVAT